MPNIVQISRESSDWDDSSPLSEEVRLIITRDQATFLMNLVEERQRELLEFISDDTNLHDLLEHEVNQVYEHKNMCHDLAILLNI